MVRIRHPSGWRCRCCCSCRAVAAVAAFPWPSSCRSCRASFLLFSRVVSLRGGFFIRGGGFLSFKACPCAAVAPHLSFLFLVLFNPTRRAEAGARLLRSLFCLRLCAATSIFFRRVIPRQARERSLPSRGARLSRLCTSFRVPFFIRTRLSLLRPSSSLRAGWCGGASSFCLCVCRGGGQPSFPQFLVFCFAFFFVCAAFLRQDVGGRDATTHLGVVPGSPTVGPFAGFQEEVDTGLQRRG